jgi:FO synthase
MTVTRAQVRRALVRSEAGKSVSVAEATALMSLRGADLERLLRLSTRLRDQGHGATITFSPKVFIPLTKLCRDHCHYCTFAKPPMRSQPPFLTPDEVVAIAEAGRRAGCKEALFTLGEKPEDRYPVAKEWLEARGYGSTLDYLRSVSIRVIEETGLLPHINPGTMTWEDMSRLKQVSASMGMMLESASERLCDKALPHHGSPDKIPAVRLRTIEDAGRLSIPFTTGILVGIGETLKERAEALFSIRALHMKYRHVQEVIVQNFRAKPDTAMRLAPEPEVEEFLAAVATARVVFGPSMHIQAPPNLASDWYPRLIAAGIDDWGGVSPVTIDHVNPEAPWPALDALAAGTAAHGKKLQPRLTVYPTYALRPDPWIAGKMQRAVSALAGADGYPVSDAPARPVPWQDPEVRWKPRTTELTFSKGSAATLRPDAEHVYGDLSQLKTTTGWETRRRDSARLDADIRRGLAKAADGRPDEISQAEALALFQAEGPALDALARVADDLRRAAVGDDVTYVINRNINFTNVCYTGCRFCAFAQREVDNESYTLKLEEVADRAEEAWAYGATEVCIQGGLHPSLPGEFYFQLVDAVKARVPGVHLHAFSPMEVLNGATRLGISFREFLQECRRRGLGSIPGTAAEILDDDVRWLLTKGKLPADTWEEVVKTAHSVGLPSSSTMMYGHVDAPPHWVAHMRRLGRIQDESGGFTEFVPLPFVHQSSPIYLAGLARPGPTWEENLRVHAMARVLLHGRIANIQVSWVKMGVEACQALLNSGANDFGGTLMEETISRMAGADWGIRLEPEEFQAAAHGIDRQPVERTTTYGRVERSRHLLKVVDGLDAGRRQKAAAEPTPLRPSAAPRS